ncbi:hypothetical protein CXB49_07410 [Chromobacterium sp. ATCC 53434]|uniref:hypothetical protein n=1 Tax=Chromobacterium TaxID=535 RepID=UPI000C75D713|nr:hypothetical protein [Chromobacterium sp. ATCC 53434]AUH50642.1 hypothetical protein CXB49_07410 [Chromobacterium sp. ATCC 53434]
MSTLLSLKQRRERGIRAAIAKLEQHEADLHRHKQQLLQERQQLWRQWRNCGAAEQVLDQVEWQSFKSQLADYYHLDQCLLEQVATTDRQRADLQRSKAEQRQRLRQALLDQEKLKLLMEST